MINAITEHFGNEGQWATLHQATVNLVDMGDRTITTQVRIDGDHVPDFSGWWLEFKGEKFILPIKDPQAAKDYTTRNSLVDLTFYSWPIYQLKRYFFMSLAQISANVAIPNKYNASIIMPVQNFVQLFNSVLQHYFGSKIHMDLYQAGTPGYYSTEPVTVEINNTYIWDVLSKFYETFNLRWYITYESGTDTYAIKVNYPAAVLDDHDFEYGYEGGLLRFERQVQDDNINNILLGRGGEKNLPYRYFKLAEENVGNVWAGDPDAIPELANFYFDRLRDINFRWYVRGWMQNPNRDTSGDEAWDPGHVFPTYTISESDPHYWAYAKGLTDENFDPVEYEKNDDSIAKYGERWGALDDNDDIYPTIQGVEVSGLGRIDEVCAVSDIVTDDIEAAAAGASIETNVEGVKSKTITVPQHGTGTCSWESGTFTVPENTTGQLRSTIEKSAKPRVWHQGDPTGAQYTALVRITGWTIYVKDSNGDVVASGQGLVTPIDPGEYRISVEATLANDADVALETTVSIGSLKLTTTATDANAWTPTFDIWVKNIWDTTQEQGETDAQYATRVWEPILGDRVGNDAKIVFSDGFMSISEDYEFVLASYPVKDRSKTINGVTSEWKITLYKSDAEFDATGLFIPNANASAKPVAGDHFYFIGIDMPHLYVVSAEENLNQSKVDHLDEVADITPTWVIGMDKVRVHTIEQADNNTALADRLSAGGMVTIKDRRFTGNQQLTLYVQSLTYIWNEPTEGSPYLVPDIEVILSDKVVSAGGTVERLNTEMSVIKATYAKTADIEDVVRKVATPLFLKKTGESDSSESPTTFSSKISSKSFRQGAVGGAGWGHYTDGNGASVLELDKLIVRQELQVNSLVANQISAVGGKQIFSAASMQCTQVIETDDSYVCYFDQRQGTVANLFQVGDIAMGQEFNPDNTEQRYYRAVVTAVDADSITLSKAQKDGAGAPLVGDTIVQYGNISNTARQYVIVRDVIGGGHERMLSGLNAVNASGTEYYFAGQQNGSTPRWFVGATGGDYAAFQNGGLTVRGNLIIKGTDGSYQSMTDYMAATQAQIDGQITSWSSSQATTTQSKPYPQYDDETGQITGTPNFPAANWTSDAEKERHFGDIYVDDTTGQGYRYTKRLINGTTQYYWTRITDEQLAALQTTVEGMQYLTAALLNGTTIVQGGLVLSSLIQLGQTENGVFKVYSGINGVLDQTLQHPTTSIAAWYGGPMVDHEKSPSAQDYAKSLFRHDGSGYLASGSIYWTPTGTGGIPGITWNGSTVVISGSDVLIDGNVKLASLSGDSVTSLLTLVQKLNNWFGEDANGNIYVKKDANNNPRNFYSFGGVSAFGANSGGGGGGGIDIDRVWQSLTNNPADPDYQNTKIALEHIPIGNGFTQRTVSGVTYFDADIRSVVKGTPVAGGAVSTANGVVTIQFPSEQSIIDHARDLLDADDLFFKRSEDEGRTVTISDTPGVTGTVLWGAEDANQVTLSVNGMDKALLKPNSIAGIKSSISTLSGNISALNTRVNGLVTGVSSVAGKTGAVALVIADIAGLTSALASKLEVAVTSLGGSTGAITLGSGLTISGNQLSVTGQTQGTVTRVDVGSSQYSPDANGVVGLPAYPTTLPASDVYAWAKKASLDVADVPNITTSKVSDIETWISGKGYITKSVSDLTNYYLKSETYTQTELNNIISGLNLGTASQRGVASVISADNANLTPSGLVYSYVNTMLSSVLKWVGETTTDIVSNPSANPILIDGQSYTAVAGNVVSLSGTSKEFRFDGTLWKEMGDEASYAYKTISITGTGYLTGGGTLEANRTIDIATNVKSLIDNAVPNTRKVNNHALSADISLDKTDVGLGNVDNLAASGYFTLLENDNNQISVTIGGTNKKLTVAYASNAGTLEGHAASYFATATDLSSLSGRVSTLEGKNQINWDEIFGIDSSTGAVYVKKQTVSGVETARDFYSYGGVSAFGTGGSSGGSNIDLPRMWQALMNTQSPVADSPTNLIAVAHIPDLEIGKITGLQTVLNGKQAVISDLADIRAGAALGATAVQTETDPTVPAWAKNQTLQVADVPTLTTAKISDIETWIAGKGYATSQSVAQNYQPLDADLTAIAALTAGGLLRRNSSTGVWDFDTSAYLTGIDSEMIENALGYIPMDEQDFTQSEIKRVLGIYDWALASTKPSYNFSEIGNTPTTLGGYGITDAHITNGVITLGGNTITPLTQHQISWCDIEDDEGHQLTPSSAGATLIINGAGGTSVAKDVNKIVISSPSISFGTASGGKTRLNIDSSYADYITDHQTIYGLTINNAAGTQVLSYTPNSSAGSLTLSAAMAGVAFGTAGTDYVPLTIDGTTKNVLTDHQYIYILSFKDAGGNSLLEYDPTGADEELQLTKAMVGLSNVENTALSTWAGSNNITTLGTIATGVWHGTAIGNEYLALDMSWVSSERSVTHDEHDYVGYTAN